MRRTEQIADVLHKRNDSVKPLSQTEGDASTIQDTKNLSQLVTLDNELEPDPVQKIELSSH
jgi:hypothetical protein